MVPAPKRISGTSAAIASIAFNATGVRKVTSTTRMPPRTNAFASGPACATSPIVTPGTTGLRASMAAIERAVLIVSRPVPRLPWPRELRPRRA